DDHSRSRDRRGVADASSTSNQNAAPSTASRGSTASSPAGPWSTARAASPSLSAVAHAGCSRSPRRPTRPCDDGQEPRPHRGVLRRTGSRRRGLRRRRPGRRAGDAPSLGRGGGAAPSRRASRSGRVCARREPRVPAGVFTAAASPRVCRAILRRAPEGLSRAVPRRRQTRRSVAGLIVMKGADAMEDLTTIPDEELEFAMALLDTLEGLEQRGLLTIEVNDLDEIRIAPTAAGVALVRQDEEEARRA